MRYEEIKIPYPNPYYDGQLMIKEIINGTFTLALFSTLSTGQPIDNRYVNFNNTRNFIKNVTKNSTDVTTYVKNDDGMAYTMPQIKQMSYLPVTIDVYKGGVDYVYYPPMFYNKYEFTPDDGITVATYDISVYDELRGTDLYYYWDNKAGKVFDRKDENNNITAVYILTCNGEKIKVCSGFSLNDVVFTSVVKGGVIYVNKENGKYYAYVMNLKTQTYKKINIPDAYNIVTFGDLPLIAFHDRIYDIDGNEWTLEKKDNNITSFTFTDDDYYGSLAQSQFGDGIYINGVYYIAKTHTQSYALRFNFKKKKAVVVITNNDMGEMTSKIKFGYFKNFFKNYGEHTKFRVYHFSLIKNNDFYVTKMPLKYSEMKKDDGRWFTLGEYGDFIYDYKNNNYYWTWDFSHYFKLTDTNKLDKIKAGSVRLWFKRATDDMVGFLGKLSLVKDVNAGKAYLKAYGIVFYKKRGE